MIFSTDIGAIPCERWWFQDFNRKDTDEEDEGRDEEDQTKSKFILIFFIPACSVSSVFRSVEIRRSTTRARGGSELTKIIATAVWIKGL